MAETKIQTEPSMEEILASIRRIIAEDGDEKPAEVAPPAAEEEVLELTEVVQEEEPPPTAPPPAPAALREPEPEPAPMRPAAPAFAPRASVQEDDRLVSQPVAAASVAALSQLAALSQRPGLGIGNGQLTIEEMVRDLLRPMLRDWLDANLPGMVERLVKDEIGRMVREAQQ
jgi:cell pole-organizing protein PopZ